MHKAINEIKFHAKKRLGVMRLSEPTSTLAQARLQICREVGFRSWQEASAILTGESANPAPYSLWHTDACDTLINHWFADYDEAKTFLDSHENMVLFPYRTQFVAGDEHYLRCLGLTEYQHLLRNDCHRDLVTSYGTQAWDELAMCCIRHKLRD